MSYQNPLLAWVFLFLIAALGLQWMSLAGLAIGGNIKAFHLVSLLFMALFAARINNLKTIIAVQRIIGLFSLTFCIYLVLIILAVLALPEAHFSLREVVKQTFAFAVFVFISGFIFVQCLEPPGQSVLIWAAVLAAITTWSFLLLSLFSNNANPFALIAHAIASLDTRLLIYGVFKSSFVASTDNQDLQANLRHGVSSSLLTALFVSLAFRFKHGAWSLPQRVLFYIGIGLSALLIMLSLSRAVILVFVLYLLIVLCAQLFERRYMGRGLYVFAAALVMTSVILLSPIGELLLQRFFSETASYESRLGALTAALEVINSQILFPDGSRGDVQSPHNVVLDAWLGAGIIAAGAALAMFCLLLMMWLKLLLILLLARSRWVLKINLPALLGLGLIPLIRFLTAGSGTLHLGEWVALAAFLGGFAANRYRISRLQQA